MLTIKQMNAKAITYNHVVVDYNDLESITK